MEMKQEGDDDDDDMQQSEQQYQKQQEVKEDNERRYHVIAMCRKLSRNASPIISKDDVNNIITVSCVAMMLDEMLFCMLL